MIGCLFLAPGIGFCGDLKECVSSSTLEDLASCLVSHMPPRDSQGYVKPTSTQLSDLETLASQMLDGKCTGIRLPKSLRSRYSVSPFFDVETSKNYCVAMEVSDANNDSIADRGWGTLVVDNAATMELVVQAPHAKYDLNTGVQAAGVFKRTGARVLVMNGAHRYANKRASRCQEDHKESDMAHDNKNFVQVATGVIKDFYERQGKNFTVVQFHGMAASACPGVDVYMTFGTQQAPLSNESLPLLRNSLLSEQPTWSIAVPGDMISCDLPGTTNVQGRLLNDVPEKRVCSASASLYSGKFIHIEQKMAQRGREFCDDWARVLVKTLGETVQSQ